MRILRPMCTNQKCNDAYATRGEHDPRNQIETIT